MSVFDKTTVLSTLHKYVYYRFSGVRCETQKVIVGQNFYRYIVMCFGDEFLITYVVLIKKLTSVHGYILSHEPGNFMGLVSL